MLAYIFPGQGSQARGMGKDLFAQFPQLLKEADDILGYSLADLCSSDDSRLNQTQFTQPALFTVNALSFLKKITEINIKPDYALGHSLGEYSALFAAEVFDFPTGLQLVKKRGELMSYEKNGAMCVVIGLKETEINELFQSQNITTIAIANHNSYLQSVISGPKQDIQLASAVLQKNSSATLIPLKVSGAFHSPLMSTAENHFREYLQQFIFKTPKLPVLANVNAEFYHPENIKNNLASQISNPVKWVSMIEVLQKNEDIKFEELGPGKVLTGLIQRIQQNK